MSNSKNPLCKRSNELADRLLQGASALEKYADTLSDADWQKPVTGDGRTVGVVIHHVASAYSVEIELAKLLASGQPISDVTMDVVDKMNAEHAQKYAKISKEDAIELLRRNSKDAADSIRAFTDAELERSATVSLNAEAPLTAQFFIEDHALRHSFHHLSRIKATIA
ncbi:MAG: DinB family protein [Deferribacteres bacterium]|nr:DinB family protein [candidate division KSB1 bacterium]MCB9502762.1 DinB family protein [Deferribacteres bacterium]